MMKKMSGVMAALFLAAFWTILGQAAPATDNSDNSGDAELAKMVAGVAPQFVQREFKAGDKILRYNLFAPKEVAGKDKLPLVLFLADAATVGKDLASPLSQGYGGLIWATAKAQAQNPCYVVVPQFAQAPVSDAYKRSPEADLVVPMLRELCKSENIDAKRIYVTGQGLGGMLAMDLNIAWPQEFAASLFVDSHWDPAVFGELVKQNFIFLAAGEQGKSFANIQPLEEAAEKGDRSYTFASWSAQLPLETQEGIVQTMLEKGAPINIFEFEPGTMLPAGAKGSEQQYAFDCAYRLAPLRGWLFRQTR